MDTDDQQQGVLDRKGVVMLIGKDGDSHVLAVRFAALDLVPGFEETAVPVHPVEAMVIVIDLQRDCVWTTTVCEPEALRVVELTTTMIDMERSGYAAEQSALAEENYDEALAVTIG